MKKSFLRFGCILLAATLHAQSWQLGPFTRPVDAPVITPNPAATFTDPISGRAVHWEALHTFNPAAVVAPDGSLALLYRAEDDSGDSSIGAHTSRLGLATSSDGLHFKTRPSPVLYTDNDAQKLNEYPGGTEDPRLVVTRDGLYVVTYTQWARERQRYSIGIATSRDLVHWIKHGPAFDESDPYYHSLLYKSGSILAELHHGRLVAAKLHGKYWMYWGEIRVGLATSTDLIHWSPVLDAATGKPRILLAARAGLFDSGLPEAGPPAVLTPRGIVLLYNGKNADPSQPNALALDPKLSASTYSVGEALFSAADPSKLLARTDQPVFQPERPFERTGQYAAGTTFAEGPGRLPQPMVSLLRHGRQLRWRRHRAPALRAPWLTSRAWSTLEEVMTVPSSLRQTAALLMLLSPAAFAQSSSAPLPDAPSSVAKEAPPAQPTGPTVLFDTTMGRLTCKLFAKEAPITVANFIGLATGTKTWTDPVTMQKVSNKPFYDGTTFHRVIPDFMIQGGDRLATGAGDAGYYFDDEFSPSLRFDVPGRLAMANSGPGTNGSQFFITEKPVPELNGKHTIFGQCDTHSTLLVASIARVERSPEDKPLVPVVINKVTIVPEGKPLPPDPQAAH